MSYDGIFLGAFITFGGGMVAAGLKFWKDSARQETELKETKNLAKQNALLLAAHQADCNLKNVMIGRLDERVTSIAANQVAVMKTVDRIDEKLDRVLEK